MLRELTNDFSWSKSRHEKLQECARAYYLHYYASWGGWEPLAPPELRELYVLKKLANRFTWAGSVVHASIRSALMDTRIGRPVHAEKLITLAHLRMRHQWRHSQKRIYWRERIEDFGGLVEHEYGEPIAPDEWRRNWENAKAAITWFLSSRWLPLARGLQEHQWLEVDEDDLEKTVFYLDGVKIFAIPDFAYRDRDGGAVVVDWKTGRAREGYDEQVLGYALYLHHRYQVPLERITAVLVYVNEGIERSVRIDPSTVEGFQGTFRRSVGRMRELLKDPAGNTPQPAEAFPLTQNLASCARCNFRRVCKRDATAAQVA